MHLLEYIENIVRCRTVGAESHIYAAVEQLCKRHHAAAEFEIRDRIVYCGSTVPREQFNIAVLYPHTVCRSYRCLKAAALFEERCRCQPAVTLLALLVLGLGLREMDVQICAVLGCVFSDLDAGTRNIRILGMQ